MEGDTLHSFQESVVYKEILQFITLLQKSVQGTQMSTTDLPDCLLPLYEMIQKYTGYIDEIPPIDQPMRFGNKSFKVWLDKVRESYEDDIKTVLTTEEQQKAIPELEPYLLESFGHYERIDYGTGHELSFLGFLLCLYKIEIYTDEHFAAIVNKVFQEYLLLCRKLQTIYMLEPAGSHGVWGLDDYQHLPFIFGAGQLVGHDDWTPEIIHDNTTLENEMKDYMYFGCIHFIKSVKKGVPFGECSPILNDISAVPNWGKVSQGMIKMYVGEVLNKHPVVKHFKFGSLIKYESESDAVAPDSTVSAE
uniref:Serine/threonine-protein phosphatase 2A activator n=1 Tax=Euplotes crassus TaxID=5936 RepID=A0A7S3KRF0_EUPCR|mmetsp:Transcript_3719/g.3442  ORF Transcript_3719/g.3442 Transcript_3719/m.3442 type:complete len:305 (+) Transcript_3719:62-976(+)|eukprot:CAMPEP_0197006264 /NCGR_PEP_ID=MMETSP1380-20130617/33883_1 /TAXON_ID=5936 /ORGANISM="Euplotes crassus, Strain CT5" /LENGTH=304 /DNA_ID=CAMNT_0042425781 /DNA_START=62 /DNA_END=976 /DNA_ORIENTATION=-